MLRIKLLCVMTLLILLSGCSTKPNIIVKTEYQEVLTPVILPIERPTRPVFNTTNTPNYVLEVLIYTELLENIIDKHNSNKPVK